MSASPQKPTSKLAFDVAKKPTSIAEVHPKHWEELAAQMGVTGTPVRVARTM